MQDCLQGFSGYIQQVQLSDVIQLACLAHLRQVMRLESEERKAAVFFSSGQVIHAEADGLSGEEALMSVLQWSGGRFEVLASAEAPAPTITRNWEFLLIEAIRLRAQSASGSPESSGEPPSSWLAFSGELRGIELADLIQLMCMAPVCNRVSIQCADRNAMILLGAGQIFHAWVDDLAGEDAFLQLFRWTTGSFEVLPCSGEVERSIGKPWELLLMEAMRIKDEATGGGLGEESEDKADEKSRSLFQRIQKMRVVEKIRLAMTGEKEARMLLIRDSSRLVQFAVISNPRITDGEVIAIANAKGVDEDVLRRIAGSREWMKIYHARLGLVKNPKTPLPIAAKLVPTLLAQDLKLVARSKAVPIAVAQAARRLSAEKG